MGVVSLPAEGSIRVAVVGLGNAGQTLHLPALAGIPSACVVGACDIDESRRDRAAARWRVPVFDDFDRMLHESRPDVVIVGTPPDSHADFCMRAFAAGSHVICEKPFVPTLAEADRVLTAAVAARRGLAFNHEFREMPIFKAIRAEVDRQGRDELVFAQVWQLMNLPPWAEPGWRGQLLQRTLHEAGVHLVDLLMAIFGEKPESVQSAISTGGLREERTDAVALVTLQFSRGRLAQIVQNRLCKGEWQYFEVRADMSDASLRASFGGRARLSAGLFRSTRPHLRFEMGPSGLAWREMGTARRVLARNGRDPGMMATRQVLAQSLAAFAAGTKPPIDGVAAREVLEVIAACYEAAATGRRVRLDGTEAASLAAITL
jgi:predicted dehydrogenase